MTRRKRAGRFIVVAASWLGLTAMPVIAGKPAPAPYRLTELGSSDGGYRINISDDGLVLGDIASPNRVAIWDTAGQPPLTPPAWVDSQGCPGCPSFAYNSALSSDGNWFAGGVCYDTSCSVNQGTRLMIWNRNGASFDRTPVAYDDPPGGTYVNPVAAAVVAGVRTVAHPGGLWRETAPDFYEFESTYGLAPYDLNSDGLVVGRTSVPGGNRISVADCLVRPCLSPVLLPGQSDGYSYFDPVINEVGDVVAQRYSIPEYESAAMFWRRSGTSWDPPVVLPTTRSLKDCNPNDSAWVSGVLNVVGSCSGKAVVWRNTSSWSSPMALESMDNSSEKLWSAFSLNPSTGQITVGIGLDAGSRRRGVLSPNP